jgi:hypothetical protein
VNGFGVCRLALRLPPLGVVGVKLSVQETPLILDRAGGVLGILGDNANVALMLVFIFVG